MRLDPEFLKSALTTAGYAAELGLLTAGGLAIGAAADGALGTHGFAVAGVALGFAGGLAGLLRGLAPGKESRDRRPPDAP